MLIIPELKCDEALKALKKMCREDNDINGCGVELTDEFLGAYLHGKNGDQKKAFKALQTYVSVRKGKYRDFFQTVIPSKCKYFLELPKFEAFFKRRDAEGHVLGFFKISHVDFNIIDIEDIFRSLVIAAEELVVQQEVSKHGIIGIIDVRGLTFQHVKVFTPSRIQFLFNIFVGSLPIKYKGFHLLYDNLIFHPLLRLFKAFAPRKIRERIYLHGSDEKSLHSVISTSLLPDWLGGDLPADECYDLEMEDKAYAKEDYYRKIASKW